jgi:hypothetical protein
MVIKGVGRLLCVVGSPSPGALASPAVQDARLTRRKKEATHAARFIRVCIYRNRPRGDFRESFSFCV